MIPNRVLDLILEAEGVDQPWQWPGGGSGVTIGYGYDLGYEANFVEDWSAHIPMEEINRLKAAIGLRGNAAKQVAHRFADIKIGEPAAREVFVNRNLPREEQKVKRYFPGAEVLEALAPNAFGALVSLVFNRGPGLNDDPARPKEQTRREMRNIRQLLRVVSYGAMPATLLTDIATQIRSMKRLWAGKGLDGLLKRRDAEAALVESDKPTTNGHE